MSFHLKDDHVKSEKFKRDGAKYICKKCKNKFFSKGDVEACYDAHGPAEPEKKDENNAEQKKPA